MGRYCMNKNLSRRKILQLIGGAAATSGLMGTMTACQSRPSEKNGNEFDYIIVGAGSAGSVLASRLTEKPGTRVLVLEAGPVSTVPQIDDPLKWFGLLRTSLVWKNQSAPQIHADARELLAPHGKLVGGSSAINAMIHHRPTARDIDGWNLNSWRWSDLQPMFKKSETWLGSSSAERGASGPTKVMMLPDTPPLANATLEAADRLGFGVSKDINGTESVGAAINQLAFDGEKRQHTGRTYLGAALSRPNTTLQANARVTNLSFSGRRCVGVEYQVADEVRAATAEKIILAAGALRSPKILMQAGIGPTDHLAEHGFKVVHDLPGVGENLHDHMLIAGNNFGTPEKVSGSSLHGSAAIVYGVSELSDGARDIMLNVSNTSRVFPPLESRDHGFKTTFSFTKPKSRGRLRLASADPFIAPIVDHNIFSDPIDIEGGIAALNYSRELLNAKEFATFAGTEQNTSYFKDHSSMRNFLVAGATCFGHHSGTCRMGIDDDAVVDQNLKVRGIDGLYVMDASVIPNIPSSPTNALVIAMAELAATRIAAHK